MSKIAVDCLEAVRELIDFDKLELDATWWEIMEPRPDTAAPRAHQYLGATDCTDFHPSIDLYGGGGLVTDVTDLARFMRLLLTGEVLHDVEMDPGKADERLSTFEAAERTPDRGLRGGRPDHALAAVVIAETWIYHDFHFIGNLA